MAYSRLEYTYAGGTQEFPVNFPLGVLENSDITVYVVGELDGLGNQLLRPHLLPGDGTVFLPDPLPIPCTVVVQRTVSKEALEIATDNTSDVTRATLVRAFKHIMMNIHEVLDGRFTGFHQGIVDTISGLAQRALDYSVIAKDSATTASAVAGKVLEIQSNAADARSIAAAVDANIVPNLGVLRASTHPYPLGSIVSTRAEGAALQSVSAGGDLITAGGKHFKVIAQTGGVDPRVFGMVAGTGLNAAQVAQNDVALMAAAALNTPLRFSPGRYEINRVQLPPGVTEVTGAGATLVKVGDSRNMFDVPLGTPYAHLRVNGITFDGNCDAEATRDNASSCIYFGADTGRLEVTGCTFKNPRGRAVYVRSTGQMNCATVQVTGNFFTGGKEAELDAVNAGNSRNTHYVQCCDVYDADISHNRMALGRVPVGYGLAGIVITTFDVTNSLIPSRCTIIGNTLENLGQGGSVTGSGGLGAIEFYKGAGRAVIQGNRLTGGTGRQINVKCDTGMSVISGNIVHDMHTLAGLTGVELGPAIIVNGSVENTGSVEGGFVITGNNIRNCPVEGIFINGEALHGTSRAVDYSVTGNVVSGCTAGIRVRNVRDAHVSGNVVSVCSSHGIDFGSVQRRITVRDNDIDCAGIGVSAFGAGTGTEDVIIQNNYIRGTPSINNGVATNGILINANYGGMISGNDIKNTSGAAIRIVSNIARFFVQTNKMGPNTVGFVQTVNAPAGSVISQNNSEQT